MGNHGQTNGRSPRCIALIGPNASGKTTLFEALLARTGVTGHEGADIRKTIGDHSPEAQAHAMSVELNIANIEYLGDAFTLLDCPGSVEFLYDGMAVLPGCDAAVVVCEADDKKLFALQMVLKSLEAAGIPHMLFVNKIDKVGSGWAELLKMMQSVSRLPLVLRQVPIFEHGAVSGFVDLALERAYVYRDHALSEIIEIPSGLATFEAEQRFSMLEKLADYDDELMEQLLSDEVPPRDRVFQDLIAEFKRGQICPIFFGSAEHGNGLSRLLKALRHEAPFVQETARRLGLGEAKSTAYIMKTIHTSHAGKLSLARVLAGQFADGASVYSVAGEEKVSGVYQVIGNEVKKRGPGTVGEVVALGKLESMPTGTTVTGDKNAAISIQALVPPKPVYGLAIAAGERKDEIKLTASVAKLVDEDPSLSLLHDRELSQMVLWGQGEMHLRVTLERLMRRFGIKAETRKREIPYKETIRKSVEIRGRHKKQSGGHGQFGDVVVEISPQPRGEGFAFSEVITGGAVPRNYFPAVEAGVRDYLGAWPARFSGRGRVRCPEGRLLSHGRFVRNGVPHRRPHRHVRGHAEMLARASRTDPVGQDLSAVGGDAEDQRHDFRAARADPRLRRQAGLGWLGYDRSAPARSRNARLHHRAEVGDVGRGQLRGEVRPPRGNHRQARRADRRRSRRIESRLMPLA